MTPGAARVAGVLALMLATVAGAGAQQAPRLRTNESDIVAALQPPPVLAIDDPLAVFAFVLNQLPERVQVYPTENYYYCFVHNGAPYAGNIRLAAGNRDRGEVNVSYGEQPADWNPEPKTFEALLGATHGVRVERIEPLLYRISLNPTRGGRSVVFALNDLSRIRPPAGFLRADEQFLGPVFDESALRFFLVFNARLKIFHFMLDETEGVADQLFASKASDRIVIGVRTGFAFYRHEGRAILIGVHERQSRLNTVFDGPFDQLPENFIEGDALRAAILAADPDVKRDEIDRLGNFRDGASRYLIHPYMLYRQAGDLAIFHRCATSRSVPAAERPRCFVIDNDEAQRRNPRPLALKRR